MLKQGFLILLFLISGAFQEGRKGTAPNLARNQFTDPRDQRAYDVVLVDDIWWFNEALDYASPGSILPKSESHARLYPYEEIAQACPPGWQLPSADDFDRLILKLGLPDSKGETGLSFEWGQPLIRGELIFNLQKTGFADKKRLKSKESMNLWLRDDKDMPGLHVHMYDPDPDDEKNEVILFRHHHEAHNPIRHKRKFSIRCVCKNPDQD